MPHDASVEFDAAVEAYSTSLAAEFRPHSQYSALTDALHVFTLDVPTFRLPVCDDLTVLVSALDQKTFAGCIVHGARAIAGASARLGRVSVETVLEHVIARKVATMWHLDPRGLSSVRDQFVCLG